MTASPPPPASAAASPPPATAATTTPPLAAAPPAVAANPTVASLQAMFPTLDTSIVESVLAEHGGNENRAIESLLAMTDEDFQPPERPAEDVLRSQSDLDASFAHALQMEEEQGAQLRQQQSQYRPPHQQAQQPPHFDPSNVPYQPRVKKGAPGYHQQQYQQSQEYQQAYGGRDQSPQNHQQQQQQQQQGPQGPGLEEQFQKIALTGKKTFEGFMASGFMKNVKEKVASVTTAAPVGGSQQQNNYEYKAPQFSASTSSTTHATHRGGEYPSQSEWAAGLSGSPATQTATSSPASSINVYQPPSSSSFPTSSPPPPTSSSSSIDNLRATSADTHSAGGQYSPSLLNTRPSPPAGGLSSSPSNKIDFAKLGLLPKQKISLDGSRPGGPTSPTATAKKSDGVAAPTAAAHKKAPAAVEEDDDDDLEYTRNPFDEDK